MFLITNKQTDEEYFKKFTSSTMCLEWIENHLDLSLMWRYDEVPA